ncbi:MAG: EAL domain-containing protein [Methylobacteriaceae bacterium]|nr:EAL domain-containing protein [Methylobacteriaceae bacterium]
MGKAGLRAGPIWVTIGALALACTVVLTGLLGGLAPAGIVLAAGLVGALGAGLGLRTGSARKDERSDALAAKLDAIAGRLASLESRLSTVAARPAVSADLDDVSTDIGVLSGTVANLVETLTAQRRDLARLEARLDQATASPPAPQRHEPPRAAPELGGPRPAAVTPSLLPPADEHRGSHVAAAPLQAASGEPAPDARPAATQSQDGLSEEARRAALDTALRTGRLELLLQPIVELPQRRPYLVEATAHLRLGPDTLVDIRDVAPDEPGARTRLDESFVARAALLAANISARGGAGAVLCSLSSASFGDLGFHEALVRIAREAPSVCRSLALAWPLHLWRGPAATAPRFRRLRELGFTLAADRVVDRDLRPASLAELGIRYLGMHWSDLVELDGAADGIATEALVSGLASFGVQVLADGVDREEVVPELIEVGIALAKGVAFGRPRPDTSPLAARRELPAPGAVLSAPHPATSPGAPATVGGEEPEPKRSLRSLLRRAG